MNIIPPDDTKAELGRKAIEYEEQVKKETEPVGSPQRTGTVVPRVVGCAQLREMDGHEFEKLTPSIPLLCWVCGVRIEQDGICALASASRTHH
jgi:hypothetical protein